MAQGQTSTNVINPGYPIVGGDTAGQNLVLRSNSTNTKGSVILDEVSPSYGASSGALQVYGGVGVQHNVSSGGAFLHMPYGQSLGNIVTPSGFGGAYSGASLQMGVTATSAANGVATVTFVAQSIPPFAITWSQAITSMSTSNGIVTANFASWGSAGTSTPVVGQKITISNVTPTGYNGTFTVLTATTTQVTFACSQTGSVTTQGIISSIGDYVTIAAVVPTAYNGTYQPINCTTTTISYPSPATGSITTTGIIFGSSNPSTPLPTPTLIATSSVTIPQTIAPLITVSAPNIQGGIQATASANVMNYTVGITNVSGNGTTATLTFNTQPAPPFPLGSLITISNVTPTGYNGQYIVTACTTTTVSYLNATSGTTSFASGAGVINGSSVTSISITNPGTGYTQSPQITFADPSPIATTYEYINTGAAVGVYVTVGSYVRVQQTANATGTKFVYLVVKAGTTGLDYIAGNSVPTQANGYVTSGNCTLLYIGTIAQGFSSLGYSGIITQGAIHQLGGVVNCVLQVAGAGYGIAPSITFSPPQMVGGRTAQANCIISGGAITFINITDSGTGYLYPPTVTITPRDAAVPTTVAVATAVIGNPGEKPIVSTLPISAANTYYLDFGLNGHNVVYLTVGASSTVYFDNINNTGSVPYIKGFPQGRRITLYVKATAGITMTFSNLVTANTNTGANTAAITSGRTGKFEFIVLTTSNPFNQAGTSTPGGTVNDVFGTLIFS